MIYLPYVQEAIAALGYIKPEFDTALAIMLEANEGQHPKAVGLAYRKIGEQLSYAEKKEMGLRGNAFYSQEAQQSLTDKGRTAPLEAHVTTLLRAGLNYFRDRTIENGRAIAMQAEQPLTFQINRCHQKCVGCDRLDGKRLNSNEVSVLVPPQDCQREACTLTIMPRIDWLAGIK